MDKGTFSKMAFGIALCLPGISNAAENTSVAESRMEAIIETRYSVNEMLSGYNLDAEVNGSLATLEGKVSTSAEKELAGILAKDVDGINSITNNIFVDENIVSNESESFARKISDASTTARVKSRFIWSSGVPAMSINVNTVNEVVTLQGIVGTKSEQKLAGKLASSTKGVRRVDNMIVVKDSSGPAVANKPNSNDNSRGKLGTINFDRVSNNAGEAIEGAGETLSDAWITTKATTSLSFTRDLHVDDLSVKTENGVVSLTGKGYSNADKELAAEIVKDVKGVKSVLNQIKVN